MEFYFINNRYGDTFLVQKYVKFYAQEFICCFAAINGAASLARKITAFKNFIVMECWLSGFTIAIGLFSLLGDYLTLVDNIFSSLGVLGALFISYSYSYTENIFKES